MEPKIAAVAAVPEPKTVKVPPSAKVAQRAEAAAAKELASKEREARIAEPTTPPEAEMRLVIEMDQASGSYVYKTINRLTGEVVSQLPRAEVLKLKDERQYTAGTVIRTEA